MTLQKMQLSVEVSEDGNEYYEIYRTDLQKLHVIALDFEYLAIIYRELKRTYGYEVKLGYDSLGIAFRTREQVLNFEHIVVEIIEEIHHDFDGKYTKFRTMVASTLQEAMSQIEQNISI